ncbi:hypothetical protein V8C86DRAFT_2439838 [Haematococcus lacustris]
MPQHGAASGVLAGLAASDYGEQSRQITALLAKLADFGAAHEISYPTIVVCGDQSAGKSSIIQRISGIDLPRSSGTCTRCPMEAIFNMLGVDLHKETFYRTTQLEELHEEVKELTLKEVVKLMKPSPAPVLLNLTASHGNRQEGFVICSDGWRYKYAANGTPLVNFILLKPDGGVLFIKVKDVSGKRKDAVAIKDEHLAVLEELRKELELQGIACWCMLLEVMQELMQEVMQEEAATLGTPTASVADILGDVKLASMVSGDSEAIRTELKNQQLKMHVRDVHSIRANNPTRFAGLLLMAQDMQVVMGAILGMTSSVTWEEVRSSSVNASVFDKLTSGWWKSLNMVVDLMEPIGNAIHRLEADMPYLSQV